MVESPAADTVSRRRPKNRKQQILERSRDLFVDVGFPNVSMASIAEHVGITAGALYRHFDSKQVLFEEVMRDSFDYLDHAISKDDIEAAIDDALVQLMSHPYSAELWSNEARYLSEDSRRELRHRMRIWTRGFVPPLLAKRPDLDLGQQELIVWGLQSGLAFLGSRTTQISSADRLSVVRASALALVTTSLLPTGAPTEPTAGVPGLVSTRERLLLAAIEQFSKRGYRETTLASIGAAVDVSGQNLYGYFANKVDLLRSIHERWLNIQWHLLDSALRSQTSDETALGLLISGQVDLAGSWAGVYSDLATEPELRDMNRNYQREYVAEWVALLCRIVEGLDDRSARVRVLIAFKMIDDLSRTPHVAERDSFRANLALTVAAVLSSPADGERDHGTGP